MIGPADAVSLSPDTYAPELRTALVLSGVGTAGVYHAGVLRALQEAGVKIDVVAGRGVGVVGALFAAIDAAPQLWEPKGLWSGAEVRGFYGWLRVWRVVGWALGLAGAIVCLPVLAAALGLLVYPVDFLVRMTGAGGTAGLVGAYVRAVDAAFAPSMLPTWLPRAAVLVLTVAAIVIASKGLAARPPRRARGRFWWRLLQAPLSTSELTSHCWRVLWRRMGGGDVKQPLPAELSRRYAEFLAENLDQPGFRTLVVAVHDLDSHRDLVGALVPERERAGLFRRPTSAAADVRRAEVLDLAGADRNLLADIVAGALSVPLVTEPHRITFQPGAFWRGETHRLCDRPASLSRLLEELAELGVEQAILVSAAPEVPGPHALPAPRLEGRARAGEYLQSAEAAAVGDAVRGASRIRRVFLVRPAHNPIGPFDLSGGFDERSDRGQPLGELMIRGYEDAYRQFVEPIVAV